MASLVDERGLQVVTPDPTGTGGLAINGNFKEIAKRAGPFRDDPTTDPTVNDDSADTAGNGKFFVRSTWLNQTTGAYFINIDDTPTAAVWLQVLITDLTGVTLFTTAGDVVVNPFDDLTVKLTGATSALVIENSDNGAVLLLDGDPAGSSDGIGIISFRALGAERGAIRWNSSKGIHFDQGGVNQDYTYDTATQPGIVIWKNNCITGTIFADANAYNIGIFLERETLAAITASTTQSQGEGALLDDINEVSTVVNTNDTVTLPVARDGRTITVINNGANTLQLFPASGDNLGAGADTATTIPAGEFKEFTAINTTNWEETGSTHPVPAPSAPGVFDASSEGESTTTSTSFIEKVKLTFTAEAADYIIEWSAEIKISAGSQNTVARAQEDDTTDINEPFVSLTDYMTVGGWKRVTLTAASHDFDIDFRSTAGTATASIRRARIKAMKIVDG